MEAIPLSPTHHRTRTHLRPVIVLILFASKFFFLIPKTVRPSNFIPVSSDSLLWLSLLFLATRPSSCSSEYWVESRGVV